MRNAAKIESPLKVALLPAALLACWSPGFAQDVPAGNVVPSQTLPGDVYVNESFEAAGALNKARTLAAQDRWREAAEVLQNASDSLSDHIVSTPTGYEGLRGHVSGIICGWPEAGIRAYQSLYDPILQRELRALGDHPDVDAALLLFDRYFCTETAAQMADQIAQSAIEAGDLELAQWALRQILSKHPVARSFRTRYEPLLEIVAAMQGQSRNDIEEKLGATRLRWKGRDATLADALADIQADFGIFSAKTTDDWPVFAGNPGRNRASASDVNEPGLLWRYWLTRRPERDRGDGIMDGLVRGSASGGAGFASFPVVAGDLIYVQVFRDIVALHRNSGAVAWSLHSDESDPQTPTYPEDRPLGGDSPAWDEGRLFVALPSPENTYYDYETARVVPELVALDGRTGDVLWRVSQKSADSQGTATTFDSAPLARHGRVYIVSRRKRSFGFEDCYLDAYRATDGGLLFRTHLGSASTSALGLRGATRSIAALHGDRVFVCTNLGTIASVGAYTGGVRWLRFYDRYRPDPSGPSGWAGKESGVPFNPIIWSSGRVIALPTDGPKLIVLDAADGKTLYEIPTTRLANMHSLLGVQGDMVCGVGDDGLCFDLARNEATWSTRIGDQQAIAGRGVWTGAELLIPFREGLGRMGSNVEGMQVLSMGPHYEGGNVLALSDRILIAGADEILCYVRKAEIWKSIRERMAAAPNDPIPALEFCEIALGAGEVKDAMEGLRLAVARIQTPLSLAQAMVRSRIFADTLKLLEAQPFQVTPEVDELFGYAAEAAADSAAQVEYRFGFAEFFERAGAPARAVRLYQQVLRDRALREWTSNQAEASVPRTHLRAAARIDELIKRHGAEVYAEFEAQAREWLEAARAVHDEDKLQELLETFPNSAAAAESLVARAELLADQGRHLAAAHAWEQAYKQLRDLSRRPELIRKIADSFEKAGKEEMAYLWLAKAAREYPAVTLEHNGRTTNFAAYRDRLSGARQRVEPRLAQITLPLERAYEHDLVGPVRILSPKFMELPTTYWGNLYVANPDGIRGFRGEDGRYLWQQPAPVRMNAELLLARSDVAVFATPFEVFALDVSTGARRFSHGEYSPRLWDMAADWEGGTSFRAHATHGDRLVSVREDGLATCIDVRTGDVLWRVTRRPAPLGPVRLSESVLVSHISREGKAVIQVASADTGELLESVVTDEMRPVEDLHVTLDGQVVMVTSKSLARYDTARQERAWQLTLSWPIRKATLRFDMDSAFFLDEAGILKNIGLADGRAVWESQRLLNRSEENETLHRVGEYLILSSRGSVSAVDVANGQLLWQGTVPETARYLERVLTSSYIAALQVPQGPAAGGTEIYFYDHRNASGVIPRTGGVLDLGEVGEVQEMMAVDGAMVVQAGTKVIGYTRQP